MSPEPSISQEGILKAKLRDMTRARDELLVIAEKQAREIMYLKEKLEQYERKD